MYRQFIIIAQRSFIYAADRERQSKNKNCSTSVFLELKIHCCWKSKYLSNILYILWFIFIYEWSAPYWKLYFHYAMLNEISCTDSITVNAPWKGLLLFKELQFIVNLPFLFYYNNDNYHKLDLTVSKKNKTRTSIAWWKSSTFRPNINIFLGLLHKNIVHKFQVHQYGSI